MTNFIHILAYIGLALLFISVLVNVLQHIRYQFKADKDDDNITPPEILPSNDYTFVAIIFGLVFIISSELLKLIYSI